MTLFVDSSALAAMICKEPEAVVLAECLDRYSERLTNPMVLWETVRAVSRLRGVEIDEARAFVEEFLRAASIRMVAIEPEDGTAALEAHRLYGKGMHCAELNFGDCFVYASVMRHDAHLLYKGNDFIHTDLINAVWQ